MNRYALFLRVRCLSYRSLISLYDLAPGKTYPTVGNLISPLRRIELTRLCRYHRIQVHDHKS
jgi:hypothetical protein